MGSNHRDGEYRQEIEHYRNLVDSSKSFTTPAVLTLILYFILWIPGLIANIVYLREASGIEQRIGRAPEGKGCLVALLIVFGGIIGLGVIFWVFIVMAVLSTA